MGDRKAVAWGWTALTVLLAAMVTGYAVALSLMQKTFWNLLSAREAAKFTSFLKLYFVIVVIGPIIQASFTWVKARLSLMWRQCLTEHFLTRYFSSQSYYKLSIGMWPSASKSVLWIDNPDQRISENVMMFTQKAVTFLTTFGVAIFDFLVFSVILFRIYPPLFYTLVVYSAVGTWLIVVSGRDLLRLNRRQVRREADFRYALVRVRETTESVAFYAGEQAENSQLQTRFRRTVTNAFDLLKLQRLVEVLATGFRYFAQLLPSAVMAPRYFAGEFKIGIMSQIYITFNKVLTSLSLFAQEYQALAEFSAGVRRLTDFSEALDIYSSTAMQANTDMEGQIEIIERSNLHSADEPYLKLSHVTVKTPFSSISSSSSLKSKSTSTLPNPTPAYKTLVHDISFEVMQGDRLLIIGDSGIGKSSMLRVICGLWTHGTGRILRPSSDDTLFLPQKPFIMLGTLRENLIYPRNDIVDDSVLIDALRKVNLPHLADLLNENGETLGGTLSLGEQQRLAFARFVVCKPRFVVLDESTSALDLQNEERMYALVRDAKVTCVSVGNRPSLLALHNHVIRIEKNANWSALLPDDVVREQRESLSIDT